MGLVLGAILRLTSSLSDHKWKCKIEVGMYSSVYSESGMALETGVNRIGI